MQGAVLSKMSMSRKTNKSKAMFQIKETKHKHKNKNNQMQYHIWSYILSHTGEKQIIKNGIIGSINKIKL